MRSDIHTFSLLEQRQERGFIHFLTWLFVFSNCNSLHNVTGAASHQWHWFSLFPFFLFISLAECLHLKQFLVSYCFYYKSQPNFNSLFTVFVPFFLVPGHHQQHHHPQHDLHQNLTEVWAVGRQPGQHCVRPGLFHRAAAAAGKYHPRTRCQHTNIKQQQQQKILYRLYFFLYISNI